MVSGGGDTCIASAVSLPLTHFQAVPIANNSAMNAAVVDQLKEKLLLVVENNDESVANDIITQLENAALNKELLEITRIGLCVNEVRKQKAEQWPEFSKRCRAIIKQWQKLAEYRPSSSCEGSSNGGTPQLISPALRRGLTPKTPGKQQNQQRVTSTDLPPPRGYSNVITGSPQIKPTPSAAALHNGIVQQSSGSYAPLSSKISPPNIASIQLVKQVHKSASLGAALSSLDDGQTKTKQSFVNGVFITETEKIGPPDCSATSLPLINQPPLMLKLKRSASGVQRLSTPSSTDSTNGISPPATLPMASTELSVQAARKNVQSTAELMAQLSEQLPQYIGKILEIGTTSTQEQLISDKDQSPISSPLITSVSTIDFLSNNTDIKTTERTEHIETNATIIEKTNRNIDKTISSEMPIVEQSSNQEFRAMDGKNYESKTKRKRGRPKKTETEPPAKTSGLTAMGTAKNIEKFNWFKKFRRLSNDESKEGQSLELLKQINDQHEHSFVLPLNQRHLLVMPYVDIGRPDWLVHDLPEQDSFIFPDQSHRS